MNPAPGTTAQPQTNEPGHAPKNPTTFIHPNSYNEVLGTLMTGRVRTILGPIQEPIIFESDSESSGTEEGLKKLKGNLNPATLSFNLLVPKHLKVVILLEFLSCEKHNFTGNPASLKYYVLYKIEPRLSHVFNDLFGDPLKYNISHRFVSKSILILLSFVQHVHSQLYNAPKFLYLRTLTTFNVSYTLTFLRVMAMQLNHAMISFYTRNGFKSLKLRCKSQIFNFNF